MTQVSPIKQKKKYGIHELNINFIHCSASRSHCLNHVIKLHYYLQNFVYFEKKLPQPNVLGIRMNKIVNKFYAH